MRSAFKTDDLTCEPSLAEALADPVVQAVMARDGVSEEELRRVIASARARLVPPADGVVTPFRPRDPRPRERRALPLAAMDGAARRPQAGWPFHALPDAGATSNGEE